MKTILDPLVGALRKAGAKIEKINYMSFAVVVSGDSYQQTVDALKELEFKIQQQNVFMKDKEVVNMSPKGSPSIVISYNRK